MTTISRDTVLKLAQLSSLQLHDDEVDGLTHDISSIMQYIDKLGELNTDGVEPTYMVVDRQNVWREDEAEEPVVTREVLLQQAPYQYNNQIKVPKVL